MSGKSKDTFVYIKHPDYAWVPATLEKQEGTKATCTVPQYADQQSIISDGGRSTKKSISETVNLKDYPHKVLPLQNVDNNGNLIPYADMVSMAYLHEVSLFFLARPPQCHVLVD